VSVGAESVVVEIIMASVCLSVQRA